MYVKFKYSCRALHSNPLQQTELLICKYFGVYASQSFINPFICLATFVGCPMSGFLDLGFAANNKGPNPQPADDPRAMIALARVNWLHSKFNIVSLDLLH